MAIATIAAMSANGLTLKFYPYELKLNHSFNLASGSRTTTPGVQVEVSNDTLTGYGEASMPPYLGESVASVTDFLAKVDLSQFNIPEKPHDFMAVHAYLDSIAPGNYAAKAAIDIALCDLSGKLTGKPVYSCLGLDSSPTPCTSYTITNDTPEVLAQKMAEAEPYKIWKVKMGVPGDRDLIMAIRRVTDRPICVDVNQGWKSVEEAMDNILWLEDKNVLFVEQPMSKHDVEGHRRLRELSPIPIVADEAIQTQDDLHNIRGAYDGINIKLMKCGGIYPAAQIAEMAKSMGLKVMIGCMTETSCAVTAAAQLAPLAEWVDLDGNLLISNDPFAGGMEIIDGQVTLSDRPGLGIVKISEGKTEE